MERIVDKILTESWDAISILGPTASGKTKFAVDLVSLLSTKGIRGEIISADSRQVYRGMDIGTGKDIAEYKDVKYHLIDIVDAGVKYNIFEYQRAFSVVYANLKRRGILPVICGGSGLYIEAATRGYKLKEVAPDNKLREELGQKSLEELVKMFVELKLSRGERPHNITDFDSKKRVIRAIEIELANVNGGEEDLPLPTKTFFIGIRPDRERRNERIDARLEARLKEGMVEEVKALLDGGISPEDLIYYGLEYKFVTRYLIGELSYNEMVSGLKVAIHQFAKRQMTWFRGMERKGIEINWIETT